MPNHNFDTAYIDESGDIGAKGSKYLVLALWCVEKNKKISKIIRKSKQQLLKTSKGSKWLGKHGGEIKYSNFPHPLILDKLLKDLSKIDSSLYYIVYNKNGKKIDFLSKEMILKELFFHKSQFGKVPNKIIADKQYFSKKKIVCVMRELVKTEKIDGIKIPSKILSFRVVDNDSMSNLELEKWDHKVKIEHHNSRTNDHLQALDILCGAVFKKYEHENSDLLDLLKNSKIKIRGGEIT